MPQPPSSSRHLAHRLLPDHHLLPAAVLLAAVLAGGALLAQDGPEPSPGQNPAEFSAAGKRAFETWEQGELQAAVEILEAQQDSGEATFVDLALLGTLLLESERPAEALAALRPVAEREGADPAVLDHAGRAALAAGDVATAERYLTRSVSRLPFSPAARELGLLRAGQDNMLETYRLLRPWVSQNPGDQEARLAFILAALRTGRGAEAGPFLEGLPANDPQIQLLRGQYLGQTGDHAGAVQILEPLVESPPKGLEAEVLRFLADAYLETDRSADVVKLLEGRVGEDPRLALLLAEARQRTGDPVGAARTLEPFAAPVLAMKNARGPLAYQLALDYGRALVAGARSGQALPYLEMATAIRGGDPLAWQIYGEALQAAGRPDDAAAALAKAGELRDISVDERARAAAIAQDPGNKALLEAQEAMNRGESQRALAILRQEIALSPDDLRPRLLEARLLLILDRPSDALKSIESAVGAFPEHPDPLYMRGLIQMNMQATTAAEMDFRKVLEMAPEHVPAMNDLAVILSRKGERDEAIGLLERVLALRPDDKLARGNLARLKGE